MTPGDLNERLSKITTEWTLLRQAHEAPPEAVAEARQILFVRYGGAVRRYLRKVLGDDDAADELTQEFGLALIRGEFTHANPERGRFRNYVKSAVLHLVSKYRRQQQRRPRAVAPDAPELAALPARPEDVDSPFDQSWRNELLARTWASLEARQPQLHAVLLFRRDHRDVSSAGMAEALGKRLGKPLSADAVRQTLHRARERFADLLLDLVACSLDRPTAESVEEELTDLGLLEYCKPALARYRRQK